MASTFSTNLAIELIGTGDQAGTWGVTTNTNLGTLIEQAISGYVTQAVSTGADTTITIPNGATGVARNMYIELTGTGGTNTNLIVPSNKKLYFIFNNTSSGQVTVKVSGQTGVSVPNGKKMVLVCNGTDVVNGLNYIADFGTNSFTVTNLTATSATITNLIATTGTITTLSATSGNISNLVSSDASATVLRAGSATLTHLSATSASITNLALTSLTISSLSITNVSVASATVSSNLTLSGGTANGVLYLNGSKVATSGSALVFDGTNLGIGTSSPAGKVHAVASTAGTTSLFERSTASTAVPVFASRSLATSSGDMADGFGPTHAFAIQDDAAVINPISEIGAVREGADNSGGLVFRTYSAGTATTQMRLDKAGNLGIGTSSPANKLDVEGAGKFSISTGVGVITNRNAILAASDTAGQLIFQGGSTASATAGLEYARINTTADDATSGSHDGSLNFFTTTNGTSSIKAKLDSSGNLGLGVTPSAWGSTYKALEFNGGGALYSVTNTGNTGLVYNAYNNGTNWIYRYSVNAAYHSVDDTGFKWFNSASGTAGNAITFTQAMTLDASGRLGVGTTSPVAMVDVSYGDYQNAGAIRFGANLGVNTSRTNSTRKFGALTVPHYTNAEENIAAVCVDSNSTYTALHLGGGSSSFNAPTEIQFYTQAAINTGGGTERARITSGGDLLVNTTTTAGIVTVDQRSSSGTGSVTSAYNHFHANTKYVDFLWYGSNIGAIANEGGTGVGFYTSGTTNGIYHVGTNIVGFKTNNTERGQFTAGGYFKASNDGTYVSSTGTYHELRSTTNNSRTVSIHSAASNGTQYGLLISTSNDQADATRYFLSCEGGGTERATIRSNGGLANYSANDVNLASDERLKKDISPLNTAWGKVKDIEVVNYRYKDCNEGDPLLYGVIAQQVQPIVPELVVVTREATETDPEYYGIREQPMYWLAIKALQEAMTKIETLEAKVAALEAK